MAEPTGPFVEYSLEDRVVRLTMNRPPLNILNLEMLRELDAALVRASEETALAAVWLRAEGRSFCAGVDIGDHAPDRVGTMIPLFDSVCRRLAEMPAPTAAEVQGHALGGGCELVACCDFAWMAENARIGQPEIQLGVFPPVAALVLPRLIGPRWSARLILTGEAIRAEDAARIGLVTSVVSPEALAGTVAAFVQQLRGMSAAALRVTLQAHRLGVGNWPERLPEIERIYLKELMATRDASEGLQAFLEKRDPQWQHR
ncbi:MAG TPA: enoyl-CoA hydratase/isomerase family protein [Anaerolineales bacterium]|nr:enoyl-CoA hydratase/isomerase family protein [Anaerolineales bacterium]